MNRILWALGAWTLTCMPAAWATTWTVPSQVTTLAAALDSAAAGDTVAVEDGVHPASGLQVGFPLTIRGASGDADAVVLDGALAGRILDVTGGGPVVLQDLSFTGGLVDAGDPFGRTGGAVRADESDLVVQRCRFQENQASFGGAIGIRGGDLELSDTRLETNQASGTAWAAGGALWAKQTRGIVARCDFLDNDATAAQTPGDGGGAFLEQSSLQWSDCRLEGNTAQAGAGALYSYLGDSTLLSLCTFVGNAAGAGGALYLETSRLRAYDCTFEGNQASNGGALFADRATRSSVGRSTFTGNHADPYSGGAMQLWRCDVDVTDCEMTGNTAVLSGGAISLRNLGSLSLVDGFLHDNVASVSGGALSAASDAEVVVLGSTITANSAPLGGGAHLADSSSLTLDRTILALSVGGPAVAASASASATATCSVVWGNVGGDWIGPLAGQNGLDGNLHADPLLCDPGGGDDSITTPGSPCLPANNACGVAIGTGGIGCGCPTGATILVPGDQPTIAAALAAAMPGDIVGVCSGTYEENLLLVNGVHLVGAGVDLVTVRPKPATLPAALLRANGVTDSTVVAGLDLDGAGTAPRVVLAQAGTTGLRIARNRIRGGAVTGIEVSSNSRVVIGGELEDANDLLANAGPSPVRVIHANVVADSLDARNNYWGTTSYDQILLMTQGTVRTCPITNAQHDASLCAPLIALSAPEPAGTSGLRIQPNPFRGSTRIRFNAPRDAALRLTIHDVAGRRVRTLSDGAPAGDPDRLWDGRDEAGGRVAAGVYFVRLETPGAVLTRRVVHLR